MAADSRRAKQCHEFLLQLAKYIPITRHINLIGE